MSLSLVFIKKTQLMMKNNELKRSFVLGEEWIYFKFYTGAKTGDKVLAEAIKPITEHLLSLNKIDQWFFIRYADPNLHLRLRIHYKKKSNLGVIIQTVFKYIEKFVEQELIWKVQTDTYQRELERYGFQAMLLSEQLFFYDSKLFLNILPHLKNPEGETQRWVFSLKLIDNFLDCFQFTLLEKLRLLESLKDGFGKEFGINKFLKNQLDAKFRKERNHIENVLTISSEEDSVIAKLLPFIKEHIELIKPITAEILSLKENNQLDVTFENLMGSYIHMIMNRIFISKQRVHEMVIYDFLYRYYKSTIARQSQRSRIQVELVKN